MKPSILRFLALYGSLLAVTAIVYLLAKPYFSLPIRGAITGGMAAAWLIWARPLVDRALPTTKKGWSE
ncbi:hypothetical protein [Novosphingobium sp.]|uniref:hypothetical protein n=1 Tax=Novosphingobium sp. TaxID=1874826 RepID=UPI0026279CFC|nr:hypothetical protein [Novosphingobium sp.]